jgi:hypothetical protein
VVKAGEFQAVLTQVASIAAERNWSAVTEFASSLSDASQILLLEADDVDAGPLADSIASQLPGTPVTVASLEVASAPGAGLEANRVVVGFRCGQFLTPAGVEAARQVMTRPADSYRIVFVGAEVIQGPEDERIVDRGIWQSLAGEPDVRWSGQDLAGHGCLLWGTPEPSSFASGRVGRDRAALDEWLRAGDAGGLTLTAQRADHALGLAEHEAAAAAEDDRARERSADSARLRRAQEGVAELRSQVVKRLDSDAAQLDEELAASLHQLRGRLLRELDRRLRMHGDERWTDEELRNEIEGVLRQGMALWRAELLGIVAKRWGHADDAAASLLRGVDWTTVNAAVADGGPRYPDAIIDHIRALTDADLAVDDVPGGRRQPSLPPADPRGTVVRVSASGVAIAVVAALVAGPALVPVVTAGAAGAAGAGFLDRYLGVRANHQAAESLARNQVTAAVDHSLDTAREQVRALARTARRAVTDDFRSLDDKLHAAVLRQAAEAAPGPEPADAARPRAAAGDQALLASLRRQLSAALRDASE